MTTETRIEKFTKCEDVSTWDDLVKVFEQHAKDVNWIFRGHGNSEWLLQPTLERELARFTEEVKSPGENEIEYRQKVMLKGLEGYDGWHSLEALEDGLLRRFKRQCHHYISDVPKEGDFLEWLALMQHHGAPTRLLDWTYSFWVAVYFSLVDAPNDDQPTAVWAINSDWLGCQAEATLNTQGMDALYKYFRKDRNIRKRKTFKKLFRSETPFELAFLVNPYRLNQRLVIQQGVFLCPTDLNKPFEDNLAGMWHASAAPDGNLVKYILSVSKSNRKRILQKLHRMNINHASLFPGLEGFSRSLKTMLVFPHILATHENYKGNKQGTTP